MSNTKPYYWKSRKAWYINVKVDGKSTKRFLGKTRQAAYDEYKRNIREHVVTRENPKFDQIAAKWILVQLDRLQRGEVSAKWITRVSRTVETMPDIRCAAIDSAWANKFVKGKSSNYARTELACIKQVLTWATLSKLIASNPLAGYRLPSTQSRKRILSLKEHNALCRAAGKKFKPILRMAWLVGCRPGELREMTWAHVMPDFSRAVFTEHKTDGKTDKPRVLYFSPRAQKLLRKWKKHSSHELVFVNHRKKPWTANAVICRMRELRKVTGLDLVAYDYRHTWITRALLSGVDIATVAELSGHASVAMIARVYGHLDQHSSHLVEAAAKVK